MEVAELHIEDSRTLAVAPDTLGPTLSAEAGCHAHGVQPPVVGL